MFDSSESCRPTPVYSTVTINCSSRRMLFSARSAASIWKRGHSVEVGAFSARVTDVRSSSRPYFAHGDAATLDGARIRHYFNTGRSALRLSHTSAPGTFETCRLYRAMSAFGGNPEDICSH